MEETTAERLRKALDMRGMNQATLSEKTNLTKSAISQYISGKYAPKQKALYKLATVLNVNIPWLMGFDVPISVSSTTDKEHSPPALKLIPGAHEKAPLRQREASNLTREQREYIEKYVALNADGQERTHAIINFEYAKQLGKRKVTTAVTPTNVLPFQQETVTLTEPSLPVCAGTGNYLDDNIEYKKRTVLKNKYTYGADYIIKLQGDSMEPEFHDGDRLIVTDARGKNPINGRVGIFIVNGAAFFRQPLGGVLHPYNPKYPDIIPAESDDVRYVGYVVGIIDDSWVVG